jgi:hypothetical protein
MPTDVLNSSSRSWHTPADSIPKPVFHAVARRVVMTRYRLLLAGLLVVCSAAVALAAGRAEASAASGQVVIYSNLGPGGSYSVGGGFCVSGLGSSCAVYEAIAMPFTGNGGRVTQIDMALTYSSGTNHATVQVAADNGGVPGQVLGTWSVANQPPFHTCCTLTTVAVSPSISVAAGRKYWVVANPGSNDTFDVWNITYNLLTGSSAINQGSGWTPTYDYLSAFDVLGCPKLCKAT